MQKHKLNTQRSFQVLKPTAFSDPRAQISLPENSEGLIVGTGEERHLYAFAANLVAVQRSDGPDGLLQGAHLDGGLQLVVCVGTQLHTLHLNTHYNTHW